MPGGAASSACATYAGNVAGGTSVTPLTGSAAATGSGAAGSGAAAGVSAAAVTAAPGGAAAISPVAVATTGSAGGSAWGSVSGMPSLIDGAEAGDEPVRLCHSETLH